MTDRKMKPSRISKREKKRFNNFLYKLNKWIYDHYIINKDGERMIYRDDLILYLRGDITEGN